MSLAANEFRQLNSVMKSLNLPATYNGRLSVKVLSGAGRLTAYASMVDNATPRSRSDAACASVAGMFTSTTPSVLRSICDRSSSRRLHSAMLPTPTTRNS